MRPFKFFFTIALGIIILSFIARLVIPALIIAAFLSVIFFVGRKIGSFFRNLAWSESRYQDYPRYNRYEGSRSLNGNGWNEEFSFNSSRYQMSEADYRTIKIQ